MLNFVEWPTKDTWFCIGFLKPQSLHKRRSDLRALLTRVKKVTWHSYLVDGLTKWYLINSEFPRAISINVTSSCSSKAKLLKSYCSDFYGCELWVIANREIQSLSYHGVAHCAEFGSYHIIATLLFFIFCLGGCLWWTFCVSAFIILYMRAWALQIRR